MNQRRRRRSAVTAFTLIELMVVAAMVSIVSAVALAGTREIVALAKFRADRARLFLEVASVRDESGDRRLCKEVTMVPVPRRLDITTLAGPGCAGAVTASRSEFFPNLVFSAAGTLRFNGGRSSAARSCG